MNIFCCSCGVDVVARLADGAEIYPHRQDLYNLPFWKCDTCKNFVGCHHKTENRTIPLGCIPSPQIKEIRKRIHILIDPVWRKRKMSRKGLYSVLSKKLGVKSYHTASIRSIEDGNRALEVAREINERMMQQ